MPRYGLRDQSGGCRRRNSSYLFVHENGGTDRQRWNGHDGEDHPFRSGKVWVKAHRHGIFVADGLKNREYLPQT
jgi:hypothetical protein